jgi:hypothetical protein
LYELYVIMGGSPSDKSSTNYKSQRYANNKKGRTSSFFLYRSKSTTTKQQHLPHLPVVLLKREDDDRDNVSSLTIPTLKMLEMETISPTDSESDDFHPPSIDLPPKRESMVEPHIATKVHFSSIEIRSYIVTIGDHPCCTIGCPITLDWDYIMDDTISIDEYELQKCQLHIPARTDLRISPQDRMELLLCHANMNHNNNNDNNTTTGSNSLSEMEIRRASRKFHRTKHCSIRQNERIHETFFHCPIKDNGEDEEDDDDDDTNSTDTNSTDGDDEDDDVHAAAAAAAAVNHNNMKHNKLICINRLHEI